MNDTELQTLVDAWIAGTEAGKGSPEYENNWWALERIIECSYDGNHEFLWRFILCAHQRKPSHRAIANLAAGPLEDLISQYGSIYIDQIERLAKDDSRFNYLLGGVWENDSEGEIWSRVQKARRESW